MEHFKRVISVERGISRVIIASLLAMLLLWGAGCKGKEEKSKEKDPKEMCEIIYQERQKLGPIFKDEGGVKKPLFMDYCMKLPKDYLVCESTDDWSEKCKTLIMQHQDPMNTVLVTGKLPGQKEKEEAEEKKAKEEAIQKRLAERGKDNCSQICGKIRDYGIGADSPEQIEKEKQCKTKCNTLVEKGDIAKTLVDEIFQKCMGIENELDFHMCIGKINQEMRQKGGSDAPEW